VKQELPLRFIDVAGKELNRRSFANEAEADVVVATVQQLKRGGIEPCNIGVITPYRAQVQLLETRLGQFANPGMKIATVDSFQGGECDYIIVSCVRTEELGFVKDVRRMNVALTRARYGLVVVGHATALREGSREWKALCEHCEGGVEKLEDHDEGSGETTNPIARSQKALRALTEPPSTRVCCKE
jgi:superfamily I DNA and/or RNA helicase